MLFLCVRPQVRALVSLFPLICHLPDIWSGDRVRRFPQLSRTFTFSASRRTCGWYSVYKTVLCESHLPTDSTNEVTLKEQVCPVWTGTKLRRLVRLGGRRETWDQMCVLGSGLGNLQYSSVNSNIQKAPKRFLFFLWRTGGEDWEMMWKIKSH